MDLVMKLFVLLLVFTTIDGQHILYRLHQNFEPFESPALYFPFNSRSDQTFIGRRQSKNPVRYDDYEDSENDYNDDPAYTVGTQINVGHTNPRSIQKHHSKYQPKYDLDIDPSKATSYTSFVSHEDSAPHKYSGKIKQKPKKKQYFKPVHEQHDEEENYHQGPQVFPSGTEYSEQLKSFPLRNVPNLYPTEQNKRYRNVASKGQIAKFLEDQQKAREEADEFHLVNDPISSSRDSYRQYLRAKDDESYENEYENDDESRRVPETLYSSTKKGKSSKRPQIRKKSPRKTSVLIPQSQGHGSVRSPKSKSQTIRFHLDI